MKHVIFLILILLSMITSAQNWQPFPYDSVYFVNKTDDTDVLIPVVKTSDSNNLLIEMETNNQLTFINQMKGKYVPPNAYIGNQANWLGKNIRFDSGKFYLSSLIFDEELEINFELQPFESDTQSIYINDSLHYVQYFVDSIYYDSNIDDTLKSISIHLLNTNYEQIIEDYNNLTGPNTIDCLISLTDINRSSYDNRILIGKTSGVQEIPNLTFYPYCNTFKKHISVDSLKQILTNPLFEVGDRIDETHTYISGTTYLATETQTKKIIILFQKNTINKTFDIAYNYWERVIDLNETFPTTETFLPAQILSVPYEYDSYIFTGLTNPFVYINSKWGIPIVGSYFYFGGSIDATANFAHLTELKDYFSTALLGYTTNCVTYHTLNDEPYGEIHSFDIEKHQPKELTCLVENNILKFNQPISGNIELYTLDGKRIFNAIFNEKIATIPLTDLDKGIYIAILKNNNKTVKIVVD